jgi:hypothetical protein
MGPAGQWDSFSANLPVRVAYGAVIATVICGVSLDLTESVERKTMSEQKSMFE